MPGLHELKPVPNGERIEHGKQSEHDEQEGGESSMSDSTTRSISASALPLTDGWLTLVRLLWLYYAISALATFVYQLPFAFAQLRVPAIIGDIGMPLDLYAWIIVGLAVLTTAVTVVVAAILFWRRSRDLMALIASLFLLTISGTSLSAALQSQLLQSPVALPIWLRALFEVPIAAVLFGFFLLFPNGRLVPRWSWALVPFWVAQTISLEVAFRLHLTLDDWAALGYPVFFVFAIAAQIYRYRRVSTPIERQQTKWVAAGLIAYLTIGQVSTWVALLTPLGQTLFLPLSQFIYLGAGLLVPIAFLFAMQRYHLYEIDRIVNKALVYGLLTAILLGIYWGGVVILQLAFRVVTGQESPIALVASTLLIAGLFQPLRSRLQKIINQRFYRAKYDAQQTLADFSATVRHEVSLKDLRQLLVGVVQETMQPTHVSLWLREPDAQPHHARRDLSSQP